MVKVKVKNYILFFLLLSLGCNNTGTKKFKDSIFDISKTSFVGKRLGKGINLSKKGVVEVDVGKSDLKKGTGENSVVKVDVGSEKVDAGSEKVDVGSKKVDAELEDDIELKIQNLLDEFKLSAQQKESIMDLKGILTDPSIGKDEGYKIYSSEEFYRLLVEFGDAKLKGICSVLQVIKETEAAIDNISDQDLKEILNMQFSYYSDLYSKRLRETFSLDNVNDIYDNILRSHSNYLADIVKLKEEVPLIEEGLNKSLVLLNNRRDITNYMLRIVRNNFDIGFIKVIRKFYVMLGKIDLDSIKGIIEYVEYIFDWKCEVERSINTVDDEGFREELESKLKQLESEYLKEIGKYLYDNIYNDIALISAIENIRDGLKAARDYYVFDFSNIKSQALGFMKFPELMRELSADDLEVIDYMRSLVTNSKTNNYNINEFNCVIGMIGSSSVLRNILKPHLAVFKAQKEAESAIDNIKEVTSQARLRRRFDEVIVKYKALLSNIFVESDLYSIYHSNAYQDGVSKLAIDLNEIIDAAKSL
ncbi:hypothetical protein baBA2_000982 (plasmid) [Borrelia anserina]|uniref:Uncharacterized protein n=2 Tax=Borrelia anserina TaxID=143 RepID=W5SVA2_BORAN|nr:hypothetical protein [Borrelia anserina]AHH08946.1 hypothetical protein BAN_0005801 [Borrelia anserina BA2]APR65388.1 hypothetical protein N187_A69 [Borrelia anserina Es]UPA07351.1 hypothetical protein baBA2_000982 [Borrelia anserina]